MEFANSHIAAWLILVGGIFAIAGAVFKWSFFFAHSKARAMVNLLGEEWSRIFYVIIGVLLITIGANLLIDRYSSEKELKDFLSHARSGSYFYMKVSHSTKARVIPFQVIQVEPEALIVKRGRFQITRPISALAIQNLKTPDGSPTFEEKSEILRNEDIEPLLFSTPPQLS